MHLRVFTPYPQGCVARNTVARGSHRGRRTGRARPGRPAVTHPGRRPALDAATVERWADRVGADGVSDQPQFPVEPWPVREPELALDRLDRTESLFALSNGHIGVRGNLDEGEPAGMAGTHLNSFYESHQLAYAEKGYGFPESGQSVVNATNGKLIRLLVDDEPFDVRTGDLVQHERTLDFRAGSLRRGEVEWTSPAGQPVRVTSTRLVCYRQRAVMAIRYEVEALERPTRIALQSGSPARQRTAAPPERRGSRRRGSDARPAAAGGPDRRWRTGEPDPPHAQERAANGCRLRPPVGG